MVVPLAEGITRPGVDPKPEDQVLVVANDDGPVTLLILVEFDTIFLIAYFLMVRTGFF